MRELVDLAQVERWFTLLAILLPLMGIGIGAALQIRARRPGALSVGFLAGLLGPANWLLWRIYNAIEDHYGLDSVKAMLLNLALFVAFGLVVGAGVQALGRSGVQALGVGSGPTDLSDPSDPTRTPERLNT